MPWWIALLNTMAALASTGFGIAALVKPDLLTPPTTTASRRFYPAMYAARTVPLGLAVAIAVWLTPTPAFVVLLLGVALLAQLGDIVIGVTHRLIGMAAGATFAVICHGAAVVTSL